MRIKKKIAGAACLAFGLFGASAANAAVTYTPTFSTSTGTGTETFSAATDFQTTDYLALFNIPKFDTSLGTLTSLSVTVGGSMAATGSVTNSGAGAASGVVISQNSTITDNPPQLVAGSFGGTTILSGSPNGDTFLLFLTSATAGSSVGVVGPSATISGIGLSSGFTTQTINQTSGFDPNLIGSGTFGITFATGEFTTSGGSGGNLAQSAATQDNITLGVTYNFSSETPPVPEPASMTLIATGLLGIAAITRRRRNL